MQTPIEQQVKALETYLKNQTESTFEIESPAIYTSLDCNIFKTLDKSDLLKYLEIKKKDYSEAVKVSNSTHGYVNILMHVYETLRNKFDEYLKKTSELTTSFSKNLDALNKAYANYGVELEKLLPPGQDPINHYPFYAEITRLIDENVFPKMKIGDYNPFEMEKTFFEPLLGVLTHLRLDPNAQPMIIHTSACLGDIAGLRMERKYLHGNFTMLSAKYGELLKELEEVVNRLENKR